MNSALRNDPFLAPDLRHRWDWSTWSPFIPPYFLFYRNVFESHATPRYGKQTSDISSFSSSSDFRIFSKLWKREGKDEPMMATQKKKEQTFSNRIPSLSNFRVARHINRFQIFLPSLPLPINIRIFSKLWKREGKG